MKFNKAQEAFEFYYDKILKEGVELDNTKFVQNIGFYIENPLDNQATADNPIYFVIF